MQKKTSNYLISIFVRYLLIAMLGLGNLVIFYTLFTWPTIQISTLILSLFGEAFRVDNFIIFKDTLLGIEKSCVAGSAYYLLFLLSMSIPLNFIKRIKLIGLCFFSFFLVNILRIVFMALIVNTSLFETIHLLFWNFFSTIFLILIWFGAVRFFKIKEIPFYSDFLRIKNSKDAKTRKKDN